MQLVVISHTECFHGEAAIFNQMFDEGMAHCHIRKPLGTENELRQLLDGIQSANMPRIALHQHHQLANEYGIKRLHFTEHHRLATTVDKLNNLKEQGFTLSTSVHSMPMAQQLPSVFSYAFFGPVFNAISKEDYHAIVGEDFYWPGDQKAVPMIALGGIDANHIGRAAAMNFDGAAVLGALWREREKAIELYKTLDRLCKQHAHM
jgi:thiamine-phosphate pyrophosphorylase